MKNIRFAPIAPGPVLEHINREKGLTDYNLFEAHDILRRPQMYGMIAEDIPNTDDRITIVDTGVMQGANIGIKELFRAADVVSATHQVLPDVPGNATHTKDCALSALYLAEKYKVKRKFMYVLQGETIPQAIEACAEVMSVAEIDAIGIPYRMGDKHGSRLNIAREVIKNFTQISFIHLLGFDLNFLSDCWALSHYVQSIKGYPFFGIDSSLVITASTVNKSILDTVFLSVEERRKIFQSYRDLRTSQWWDNLVIQERMIPDIKNMEDSLNSN